MSFTEELFMDIVIRVGAVLLVSFVIFLFRSLGRALKKGSRKTEAKNPAAQTVSAPPVPPPPPVTPEPTVVEVPSASQPEPEPQPLYQPGPVYQPEPMYQPEPAYRPEPQYQPQPDYRMGTVPLMPDFDRFAPEPQQNPKQYYLTAISGSLKGRRYPVTSAESYIGRSAACQIQFSANTPGVSGSHCKVVLTPGGTVTVTDVGSTYGTYLGDGKRLSPNHPITLTPGSTFLLAGLDGPAFLLEEQ